MALELHPHFWEFCAAGAFLEWAVKDARTEFPNVNIRCVTPSGYLLCGFNPDPDVWNGKTVTLIADPEKCGLPLDC